MADIVNLKRVKKARARAEAARQAAENRVVHGLPKAARQALKQEQDRQRERQAGLKLAGRKSEQGEEPE